LKFSFCPVDGTPLNGQVRKVEDSSITSVPVQPSSSAFTVATPPLSEPAVVASAASSSTPAARNVRARGEYPPPIIEDCGFALRLADELRAVAHEYELTWPEFKRDPFGFTKRS